MDLGSPSGKSPRIRLLPGGHVVVAMTLLLGVAAVHTGLNLLHALVAALLSFQAVSGFRSFLGLRRLSLDAQAPARLDAGGEGFLEVAVTNGKRRVASCSVEVRPEVSGTGGLDVGAAWIARLSPGERIVVRLPVRGTARGVATLPTVRVSSAYPSDLLRRTVSFPFGAEVLVRPRRRDVLGVSRAGEDEARAPRARAAAPGPGEIRSLRPYREGDAPRSIHWKTTARRRAPHVREDESRAPAPWAVRLAPSPTLPREDVDARAEEAAALCRRARAEGRTAWLCLAGAKVPLAVRDARSLSDALDAIARFEPTGAAAPAAPPGARRVEPRAAARVASGEAAASGVPA
jgi:uncharacterized protein (DUF58 family)